MLAAVAAGHERTPAPLGRWLGRRAGDLAYVLLARRRRLALRNLSVAFPAMPLPARRALCRRSYQHLGLMAVELCRMLVEPVDRVLQTVTLEGLEHLKAVMTSHGRALVLTGHLGNWEVLTVAHRLAGYPLSIVVRPLDASGLNVLVDRLRRASGVDLIEKRGALRSVLAALRQGRLVGILLDQNASRREGVFVPFFGRPASTSRSLALLAARTGTPIVPIFARREDGRRHRIIVYPPLFPPAGNTTEAAVVELTRQCTGAVEQAIREAPEQWLWIHDRWRTRPPAGDG
jgi:KDO2-lipid IV(A) lauroyltransferase